MKFQKSIVTLMVILMLPAILWAGDQPQKKFQLGGRSAFISGTMHLSEIDPAFDNLSMDGLTGAHQSGIFFLYSVKPWLRIGFETLVGNSDEKEATTMDFQAAGPVAEVIFGSKLLVAGGLHFGGIIADALHRDGQASDTKVHNGMHYKSSGVFFAPYLSVGFRVKKWEFRLFSKSVSVVSAEEKDKIDAFNAPYIGASWGISF